MSDYIEVIAIVEGRTEQVFIESILQPYLAKKNIFISATQVSKAGQKGGDVKFERVKRDLALHLKQRKDTYITTLVDYYGIKQWPGIDEAKQLGSQATPKEICELINQATAQQVSRLFCAQQAQRRFIPYIAIHEFEALLFSEPDILAQYLEVEVEDIVMVVSQCIEPEAINNSPETAPSKRLDKWSRGGKFAKTTTGISVAREIGIDRMREACPQFNFWLSQLEFKLT